MHIQRENILHWTYFLVHFFTMMHKLLPAALKILLFPFCPPTPRGANTTSTIKTQQSDDVHVYICTHYTVLMASEVSLRKCERQKSHVQLFSTFQRQAFSSNPTTQQSIPVCRLALFWASAILNIDYGVVPLSTQHTKRLTRPDSIQTKSVSAAVKNPLTTSL